MSNMEIYELCADSDLVTEFVKYEDHAAIVAQLEADLAEARKDQARYQWLRNEVLVDGEINDSLYVACDSDKYTGRWALVGDELDQAIDAAIKEQQ